MTNKARKSLVWFVVSIAFEIFISMLIVNDMTGIIYKTTVGVIITILSVWNLLKGFWVLLFIWSERKWSNLSNRHPGLKKIYK